MLRAGGQRQTHTPAEANSGGLFYSSGYGTRTTAKNGCTRPPRGAMRRT